MTQTATTPWKYTRPQMYPKQEAAIFDPHRISVIEANTKSGKSVGCMVWIAEQAMLSEHPGRHYWWVAPVYSQAQIIFDRLRRRLPADMIQVNNTELSIRILPVDATIEFKSGEHSDRLFGADTFACVVDEASRVKEESWFAIRSTLTATRGPVRIIGNIKGRRNWFYRLARRAEKNEDPDLAYHKITCWDAVDAGVLDAAEIESARSLLPESVFNELYLAEASDDQGNPFGYEAIQACAWDDVALAPGPVAAWGVDLGRKRDYTVGVGLDRYGRLAGWFRFQRPWPETVSVIRETCGNIPTFVDATGGGDPVLGYLQRPISGHEPVRIEEDPEAVLALHELERAFDDTQIEGYMFTAKSKQGLMEGLAVAIQHGQLGFPKWAEYGKEHPLKLELESFEYKYGRTSIFYSAPEGEHDDAVCASALAIQCLNTRAMAMPSGIDLAGIVDGMSQTSTWNLGMQQVGSREGRDDGSGSSGGWDFGF